MGSRLLNGSPQLSVRVTIFPLILIVLSSTVTPGTIAGTVGLIIGIVLVVGIIVEVLAVEVVGVVVEVAIRVTLVTSIRYIMG